MKSLSVAVHVQLSWVPTCNKMSTSILLAAAFSDGVAVYCIPVKLDVLTNIKAIAMAKTTSLADQSKISFLSFPNLPPYFAMMFVKNSRHYFMYGALNVPNYSREEELDRGVGIDVICRQEVNAQETMSGTEMITIEPMVNVMTQESGIIGILPSSKLNSGERYLLPHQVFHSLNSPVTSSSCGLTSMGFVNNDIEEDNFLNIHTQLYWRSDNDNNHVTTPYLRHWLCVTKFGDRKGDRHESPEMDGSLVTGGAQTEIRGEINTDLGPYCTSRVIPQRLVRGESTNSCAILFSSQVGNQNDKNHGSIPLQASSFCILQWDSDKCDVIAKGKGRDIIFWDQDKYLVLDEDGVFLEKRIIFGRQDDNDGSKERVRVFRQGSAYDEKLNCKRMILLSSNRVIFIASRKADGRSLLLFGDGVELLSREIKYFIDGKKKKLWLREGEEVNAMVELESQDNGDFNISVATTSRILIVQCGSSPSIIADYELKSFVVCTSLVPLGSHCVSFLESVSKAKTTVKYLSCLKDDAAGVIAKVPFSHTHCQNITAALRPDRAIQLEIVTEFCEQNKCLVKQALTIPIFVLEPLCANIIAKYSN